MIKVDEKNDEEEMSHSFLLIFFQFISKTKNLKENLSCR